MGILGIRELQVGMPVTLLLNCEKFGFRLQPDGLITVFRAALFQPKLARTRGYSFVGGDDVFVGRIRGRGVMVERIGHGGGEVQDADLRGGTAQRSVRKPERECAGQNDRRLA